jgi:hypothetical protein
MCTFPPLVIMYDSSNILDMFYCDCFVEQHDLLCSSGLWHHVVLYVDTSVSDECAVYILRVEVITVRIELVYIRRLQENGHADLWEGRGHGTWSRPTGMFTVLFNPESEGTIFPCNVGIHLQGYMSKNPSDLTKNKNCFIICCWQFFWLTNS